MDDFPSRQTYTMPTETLPDVLAFDPANPPNAALVTHNDAGDEIVLIIELLEPNYNPAARTQTLQVQELADYRMVSLDFVGRAQSFDSMPTRFGITNLFIDSADDCVENLSTCSSDSDCCSGHCASVYCKPDNSSGPITGFGLGLCMN